MDMILIARILTLCLFTNINVGMYFHAAIKSLITLVGTCIMHMSGTSGMILMGIGGVAFICSGFFSAIITVITVDMIAGCIVGRMLIIKPTNLIQDSIRTGQDPIGITIARMLMLGTDQLCFITGPVHSRMSMFISKLTLEQHALFSEALLCKCTYAQQAHHHTYC
jgi:hypothetical protein